MRKLLVIICLIVFNYQANAGFITGVIVGSALASGNKSNNTETNEEMSARHEREYLQNQYMLWDNACVSTSPSLIVCTNEFTTDDTVGANDYLDIRIQNWRHSAIVPTNSYWLARTGKNVVTNFKVEITYSTVKDSWANNYDVKVKSYFNF